MWGLRFRGKGRLLSPLVPRNGTRAAHVFGTRIDLDLSDPIHREMYLGSFERGETARVRSALRPGMTFVDVGANAGYFTYLAAERVGASGRVISAEPDPVLFAKLTAAVAANGLAHVTPLNIALGREAGELPLSVPPSAWGNRTPTLAGADGWDQVRVPVRTLDEVLDEYRVAAVDVLKLDVEGYEGEVLAGAGRSLAAGRVRAVLCEFNTYWLGRVGTTPDAVWESLLGHGFRPVVPKPTFGPGVVVTVFFTR